ncbi:hypothetical protein [Bacteroides sp.]|uniref:hypothetical protein n=1 Tax=Bacteroides sp. TaxID=29523 RepID=UPI002FCB9B72
MTIEEKADIIIAMLDDMKSGKKQQQIDLSKVDTLTEQMQNSIDETANYTAQLSEVIETARQPVVSERRFTIGIVSKEAVFIFIAMIVIIAALSSWLYLATRPNYDRIDNDLKYRYIKMKGEAAPERISELENLFEINRDNAKIRQMLKDIEDYEQVIHEKVTLEEQARQRQKEAEKLNKEAENIKRKQ